MRLLLATALCGALGAAITFVFDATLPRIVGLLLLFAFIVCGTFLVASPEFVERDGDEDGPS